MATELTEQQLINKVSDYDTLIDNALTATSASAFSYTIGDMTVSRAEYIKYLFGQREYYLGQLRQQQIAGAPLMKAPDYEISPFGEALGEEVD